MFGTRIRVTATIAAAMALGIGVLDLAFIAHDIGLISRVWFLKWSPLALGYNIAGLNHVIIPLMVFQILTALALVVGCVIAPALVPCGMQRDLVSVTVM